ncbi:MAG: prepilin-type N-terminal cleavage/methylation domain-containing protein [Pseudomonadota bacterium]
MNRKQQGFTLMEMVGVVAVIAILASIATPMIFDAIRNAKVSAVVQDVNTLKTAVARYYADTGDYPFYRPTGTNDGQRQLLVNRNRSNNGDVPGWSGPYIETELENRITTGAFMEVNRSNGQWACDVDRDGNTDGNYVYLRMDNVDDETAERISQTIDGDGGQITGNDAWFSAGLVRRPNANQSSGSLSICLMRM